MGLGFKGSGFRFRTKGFGVQILKPKALNLDFKFEGPKPLNLKPLSPKPIHNSPKKKRETPPRVFLLTSSPSFLLHSSSSLLDRFSHRAVENFRCYHGRFIRLSCWCVDGKYINC